MAPVISATVQWVILPMIMLAIFGFAWVIGSSARNAELKVSAWAGFWAGLLAFVVYVVSQLGQIRDPTFQFATLPGLLLMPLACGLGAGFLFLGLVRIAEPTRLVGLITLTLAGTSSSALFTYVFINSMRVSVLYWTLGAALGILLHIVLYPSSIEHIFRKNTNESPGPIDARRMAVPRFMCPPEERNVRCETNGQAPEVENATAGLMSGETPDRG
jgi:hypothetical protein